MNEYAEAISRIESWLRDFGKIREPQFTKDLQVVLEIAKEHGELQPKLEKCKALFDIEVDTLSKEWNKLYTAAKEACK